jgi:hypothetical protein
VEKTTAQAHVPQKQITKASKETRRRSGLARFANAASTTMQATAAQIIVLTVWSKQVILLLQPS